MAEKLSTASPSPTTVDGALVNTTGAVGATSPFVAEVSNPDCANSRACS